MKMTLFKKKTVPEKALSAEPGVVTFWSPQATGKSVLARGLATSIDDGKNVCLADFDLLTPGDPPCDGTSLDNVVESVFRGEYDPISLVKRIPLIKGIKNVRYLAGLGDIMGMDHLDYSVMEALIKALRNEFDVVIIDAGREVCFASTLAALDVADVILWPLIAEQSYLGNACRYAKFLQENLRIKPQKIRVVLNQHNKQRQITGADIKKLLGLPVAGYVGHLPNITGHDSGRPPSRLKKHLLSVISSTTGGEQSVGVD